MKHFKSKYQLPILLLVVAVTVLYACANEATTVTKQPTLSDYTVGEKWVWKYKGVTTEGVVRSEGEDGREIWV